MREIAQKYDLQALRFFMLSAHYRSPLNFSAELMEAAKSGLERIHTAAENIKRLQKAVDAKASDTKAACEKGMSAEEESLYEASEQFQKKFEAAMEDDCNTADAVSAVFELVKYINTNVSSDHSSAYLQKLFERLKTLCDVLGIQLALKEEALDADIEKLIQERQTARKNKDFARADQIRDELAQMGILLKDTREGVTWKRA